MAEGGEGSEFATGVNFKKSNKILAALSLFLIVGSYGLAESFSKKKGIEKNYTP